MSSYSSLSIPISARRRLPYVLDCRISFTTRVRSELVKNVALLSLPRNLLNNTITKLFIKHASIVDQHTKPNIKETDSSHVHVFLITLFLVIHWSQLLRNYFSSPHLQQSNARIIVNMKISWREMSTLKVLVGHSQQLQSCALWSSPDCLAIIFQMGF